MHLLSFIFLTSHVGIIHVFENPIILLFKFHTLELI